MFSKAWLALLQLELPEDIYKKVLSRVHLAVIPHMVNPLLLSDFLTKSIDKGGLIGILSLNGALFLPSIPRAHASPTIHVQRFHPYETVDSIRNAELLQLPRCVRPRARMQPARKQLGASAYCSTAGLFQFVYVCFCSYGERCLLGVSTSPQGMVRD